MRSENSQRAVLLGGPAPNSAAVKHQEGAAGSILKQVYSEVLKCGGQGLRVRSQEPGVSRHEMPSAACRAPIVVLAHSAHYGAQLFLLPRI